MTIIQLEYLLAVADYGNFSVAAGHCFVTQPSLSTQIKNLEDELGVVLLNRNEKPISLTATGKVVVQQARKVISTFYALKESVSELKNEVKGSLRLAVIPTIAPYLLHLFVPQFMKKYPAVSLEVKEMYTHDMERALNHGMVDIGLLASGFTAPATIREERLFSDPFYLYVSVKSPLFGKKVVSVGDIDLSQMLLLSDGHCLRSQVLDLCNSGGMPYKQVKFESGSLDTIIRMIDTYGGMTILPQMALPFLAEGHKRQLVMFRPEEKAQREIAMAVSTNFFKHSVYKVLREEILKTRELPITLMNSL